MIVDLIPELLSTVLAAAVLFVVHRSGRDLWDHIERLRHENREDHAATGARLDALREDVGEIRQWQAGHDQLHTNQRWRPR